MLEYLDPTIISGVDPSASLRQWRQEERDFVLQKGFIELTYVRTNLPYPHGHWLAFATEPSRKYLIRGLSEDGYQYRYVYATKPEVVLRDEYLPLEDFLIP